MLTRILVLAVFAAAAGSVTAEPVTYTLDPGHTQVNFTYSHFGFSNITGRMDISEGQLVYDAAKPEASSIEVTVDVSTVSTGVAELDKHLLADDYFDVEKFPTATFKSTKVEAAGENQLRLSGDLTIHGVTQPASFDVTVNKVGEHPMRKKQAAGFDATGTIERAAFGIEQYLMVTGPEVRLNITTEALAE